MPAPLPRVEMEFAEWPIEVQSLGARVLITWRSEKVWGAMSAPGTTIDLRGVHGCHLMHWVGVVLWQVPAPEGARTPRLRMLYGSLPLIEIGVEIVGIPGTPFRLDTKNELGVRLTP